VYLFTQEFKNEEQVTEGFMNFKTPSPEKREQQHLSTMEKTTESVMQKH
jgi:hypothetical protein